MTMNRAAIRARNSEEAIMRGIMFWALGIPLPVVILLYVFHVI